MSPCPSPDYGWKPGHHTQNTHEQGTLGGGGQFTSRAAAAEDADMCPLSFFNFVLGLFLDLKKPVIQKSQLIKEKYPNKSCSL